MRTESTSMNQSNEVRKLAFILGDQLDAEYLQTLELDREHDAILMVEVTDESTKTPSHIQRTVLFLSAMRHFAHTLEADGWRVEYKRLTDPENTQTFETELTSAIQVFNPDEVVCIEPGSFAVKSCIKTTCIIEDIELTIFQDPHFICTKDEFFQWASGRKQLTMEYFYRAQRKKLDILMNEDGKPIGNAWNYDKENRKSFKSAPNPPGIPICKPDSITQAVIKDVQSTLPDLPGSVQNFNWPVTRDQALDSLHDFIQNRLPSFGDYQDAMWSGQSTLYHSIIAPAMNLKLLNPREVYHAALDAYESGNAPLNAVEGFIRQVIGWREFIRGIYWFEGPDYASRNTLEQYGSLPEFYWSGETEMACMKDALKSVLQNSYGHHIARLMVTGNFALIAGVEPQEVDAWYRGMYADAIDWVTTPNTIGMAMHADGGVVGTKPYAASGKYIQRMSNYCKGCSYDVKLRTGDNACPFNTFYWDFLLRNQKRFSSNSRMALILKHLDKISSEERVELTVHAQKLRTQMGIGSVSKS
ncbi:MAG: cryptochrome/photolyase family protein [Phycisphaerales bacterium]